MEEVLLPPGRCSIGVEAQGRGDTYIIVTMDSGGTYVAGKRICEFDISVTNGVIHEVEEVLFPPGRV